VVVFLDAVGHPARQPGRALAGQLHPRRVAETHPERVERLVLIGSAATAANEVLFEVQASMRTLQNPVPAELAREFQASTAYAPLPEAFFEQLVAESRKLPSHLWREVLDDVIAFDDAADLRRITAPTLLLWGEHDALFPRQEQERLVASIPDARLLVYPETGHCPNWERPERVADDLDAFIRQ
jgi:non-heme chloroperoxidase